MWKTVKIHVRLLDTAIHSSSSFKCNFLIQDFCTHCVCQCVAMCLGQAPLTRNVKLSADCCTI